MILLTKLDDNKILINLETVKYLESVPDTLIFFVNGDSVMVKESLKDVEKAVINHHSQVFQSSAEL